MVNSVRSAINAYNNASQISGKTHNKFAQFFKEAEAAYHINEAMIARSVKNPIENVTHSNGKNSFGNMVQTALTDVQSMFYKAENLSNKALVKKANLIEVVTSLDEAEVALKTLIALRDKSVAAYLEIMKMPI